MNPQTDKTLVPVNVRIATYKQLLAFYTDTHSPISICQVLHWTEFSDQFNKFVIDNGVSRYVFREILNYPELMKYQPSGLYTFQFWWPLNEAGIEKRISILYNILKNFKK